MTSMPDVPPPSRPSPRRRPALPPANVRARRVDPARYVGGLLAGQGAAWLLLSAAGLAAWFTLLPASLGHSSSGAVLWSGAALLAIAIGMSLGSGQLCMACRLLGHSASARRMASGLHGLAVLAGLAAVAVAVMIIGSALEALTLSGVL